MGDPVKCWACQVFIEHDLVYFDDQGHHLCEPCFWRAYAA
jgi:hypothetical protein